MHLDGEFAGNLDATLVVEPPLAKGDLLSSLWIQVPGESDLLDVLGYRQTRGRWKLTFCSEHVRETRTVPSSIEAYWGSSKETRLGTIPCRQATDADLEALIDPSPESVYGQGAVRSAKARGTLALLALLLLLLATAYVAFPEVRDWLRGLVQ